MITHRGDRGHGLDDVGAVHQGLAAGGLLLRADGADSQCADSRPIRVGKTLRYHPFAILPAGDVLGAPGARVLPEEAGWVGKPYVRTRASADRPREGVAQDPRCRRACRNALPRRRRHVSSMAAALSMAGRRARKRGRPTSIPSGTSAGCPAVRRKPVRWGRLEFFDVIRRRASSSCGELTSFTESDGSTTTVYYQRAARRVSDILTPGFSPTFQGLRADGFTEQARLPLADARAVLRHGVAAAHPDPLLHGEGPGRRSQEHRRRHREHRVLLHPDALSGAGRDDERMRSIRPTRTWRRRSSRAVSASCHSR